MISRYEKNEKIRKKDKKKRKRKFLKKLFTFIISVIVLLFIWGMFIEVNLLKVNDYRIKNIDIPESFNDIKIVHFSDIHYGTSYNEKRLNKLINKINDYKPDIVVFTGDLVDTNYNANENDNKIIIKYLSKIDSTLGKYAVVGNHDFYNEDYENVLYDSDFMILKNNYDTVYNKDNNPILIYGVDNITYGDPKLDSLKDKEIDSITYKIVLLHESDYLDEFVNNYDVDMVLAGHSHNGQIKLPFIKPLFLPYGAKKYYDSYYKVDNTSLYVSNGVGSSIYDFRLFSIPSINVYRLGN